MGLEIVEFIMRLEEALDLSISDPDAAELTTPGKLIDYLASRFPAAESGPSLAELAFVRLRAVTAVLNLASSPITLDSSFLDVFSGPGRESLWEDLRTELGARYWPRLGQPGRWQDFRSPLLHVVRDVAHFLVRTYPLILKRPGEGWTRSQMGEVVHGLIEWNFGLPRDQYTEKSRWGDDLGLS